MEIVINGCFGGFGLSDEAEDLYAKKSGFELFRYAQTKLQFRDGAELYERAVSGGKHFMTFTFKKDMGDSFDSFPKDDSYWYSRDIARDDQILIEVIDELGGRANGMHADLKIIDVPDGVSWEIEEYDGNEHVAESHSTWS